MITTKKVNAFAFFKLPSAWWCGVRCKEISSDHCVVTVRHRWLNQNPFNSMYFAVQSMAAELSTGALVISFIEEHDMPISMLVANNKASFTKKATGLITFTCNQGAELKKAVDLAATTGEGQTVWVTAQGVNEQGVVVSTFEFEWTVKKKPTQK